MLLVIINKLLLVVFIMTCVNIIRHGYYFVQVWLASEGDNPQKYIIKPTSLWVLSFSIGYFLASLFVGIFIK
jgi:hypothetical protein